MFRQSPPMVGHQTVSALYAQGCSHLAVQKFLSFFRNRVEHMDGNKPHLRIGATFKVLWPFVRCPLVSTSHGWRVWCLD